VTTAFLRLAKMLNPDSAGQLRARLITDRRCARLLHRQMLFCTRQLLFCTGDCKVVPAIVVVYQILSLVATLGSPRIQPANSGPAS